MQQPATSSEHSLPLLQWGFVRHLRDQATKCRFHICYLRLASSPTSAMSTLSVSRGCAHGTPTQANCTTQVDWSSMHTPKQANCTTQVDWSSMHTNGQICLFQRVFFFQHSLRNVHAGAAWAPVRSRAAGSGRCIWELGGQQQGLRCLSTARQASVAGEHSHTYPLRAG